jgi:hypothetical protein
VTQRYDVAGRVVETTSVDAGHQRVLPAADGHTVRYWGANGDVLRCVYDGLRRRTQMFIRDAGAPAERLAQQTVCGEHHPQALTRFLVGRAHRRYDEPAWPS